MVARELTSPPLISIIGSALFFVLVLLALVRLPKGFRKTFGPAIYIMPMMGAWGIYQFLNWLYLLNPGALYLLVWLIPVLLVGLFVLKFITFSVRWARGRAARVFRAANDIAIPQPPTPPPPPPAPLQQNQLEGFFNAPLIQNWDSGGWRPTPIIALEQSTPLTKEWVTIDIDTPQRIRQGDILIIRTDITNGHSSRLLHDKGMLEIVFPTGTRHGYGPDTINLQPNGDTVSLYYTWKVPFLQGNYILRYHLINLQSMTERVLVVD